MAAVIPSVEEIREKLRTDARWVERAIVALYRRQTADEQKVGLTCENNNVGFNSSDSGTLSAFAKQLLGEVRWNAASRMTGKWPPQRLSEQQLEVAYRLVPKYAKQLRGIATTKED